MTKNSKFKRIFILINLIGLLIACGNLSNKGNDSEEVDSVNIEHSEAIENKQESDYMKIVGDSVEIPYFEIKLELSKKAEEKLKTDNESIIVAAYFESKVKKCDIPKKYKKNIEYNILHLTYKIELTDERLARFENIKISKELYDLLEDKDIYLLINVFTGRKSSENNLLDCEHVEGLMSKMKEKRFTLKGKLIHNDD